ncbi:hypothetical protein J6590_000248 [Homalodisca vitripennis]|nr:hypothetical protein J6590_000244 [Homalodisca vitripennis]KAG8338576.1 hypothetical protein J6590_000248 [Homalodisca vitripennis]
MNSTKKAAGSEVGQFPGQNKAVRGDLTVEGSRADLSGKTSLCQGPTVYKPFYTADKSRNNSIRLSQVSSWPFLRGVVYCVKSESRKRNMSARIRDIIHTYIFYFRYNKPGKLRPKSAGGQMETGKKAARELPRTGKIY